MASNNNYKSAPTTAAEARRLLTRKSPDALNRWLAEASPNSANPLLYATAESARRTDYWFLDMLRPFISMTLIFAPYSEIWLHTWTTLLSIAFGFFVFEFLVTIVRYHNSRTGMKAAVLLAERDAERFLPPMARIWSPWDKKPLLTEAGEANFERRLAEAHKQFDPDLIKALHEMLSRAFPWRLRRSPRDFTDAQADILLAALRCLATAGGDKKSNEKVLRRIARFPVPVNAPNRALIQGIAQTFLTPGNPVILPPVITTVTEAPASHSVTLRRP